MQTKNDSLLGRPFHETVVDYINQASSAEMDGVALLIKMTKIPAGHDKIIVAWDKRRKEMCWGTEDLGVPAYLHAQKHAAMEKSNNNREKKSILQNLHKLTSQVFGK